MGWTTLVTVLAKLFSILSWPSFPLVCPLYASFWAMQSDSYSRNQQCLAFWVVFAILTMFEPTLSKLVIWLPSWPHVKGVTTVLLVMPYFGGAFYVYKHFVRPYLFENPWIWNFLFIPKKYFSCSEQDSLVDESGTDAIEDRQESENVIFQGIFEPNHDYGELDYSWPTSPNKVQKEWSCALCRVSTTSEKCLNKHLQGKKHKAEEDHLRAERLASTVTYNTSSVVKHNNGMIFIDNLVIGGKWSRLLSPVAGSIIWCSWKKPDIGWIKLNTDGSIDRENAGFGGLLRNHKGDSICAFVSKAPSQDIFLVELWAIWRGLVLALGLRIEVLWIESDSKSVVKTINREQPYSGKAESYLKDIWTLLKKFKKYKVSHSWRETNKAADYLSRMVLGRNDVVLWPKDFPSGLCNIINDDAHGKKYCRR